MSSPVDVIVHRDSVAAGDDSDAPHEKRITVASDATIDEVLQSVQPERYLASIAGGHATWIVESGSRVLAVIAQQWTQPRYVVAPSTRWRDIVAGGGMCDLFFKYWAQADPQAVFDSIQNGKPLPSRYR